MTVELIEILENRINNISVEELKFRGWTRDGMRARYEHRLNADKNSPQPGDIAPDFSLEILNQTGAQTGEMLSLSSLRGKPVGLIFGSYT